MSGIWDLAVCTLHQDKVRTGIVILPWHCLEPDGLTFLFIFFLFFYGLRSTLNSGKLAVIISPSLTTVAPSMMAGAGHRVTWIYIPWSCMGYTVDILCPTTVQRGLNSHPAGVAFANHACPCTWDSPGASIPPTPWSRSIGTLPLREDEWSLPCPPLCRPIPS